MAAKKEEVVALKSIRIERINLEIEGDSALIVHAWSAKAKKKCWTSR